MRLLLIGLLGCSLAACSTPPRLDWAGIGQGLMQSTCRQSSRCDVPACDPGARDTGVCDNPYIRGQAPLPRDRD